MKFMSILLYLASIICGIAWIIGGKSDCSALCFVFYLLALLQDILAELRKLNDKK